MDFITSFISSLNSNGITEISLLINNNLAFIVLIAILIIFTENRFEKRNKVFFVLLLALVLSFAVKELFKVARPCVVEVAKTTCPSDYSFPSIHATMAFSLMLAFINKPSYPVFFIFALIVAFSRIYIGVHTFEDIVGGLAIAPIAYSIVELIWRKKL